MVFIMKIVLVQPPVQDFYDTTIRLQPIGLACLKAAILKHLVDVEVVIRDFHQGWGRRTVALPHELHYLEEFYIGPDQSPFSTFHRYYHFGAPFETVAGEVQKEKPDLVGISSLFSPYYREVLSCCEAIRKRIDVPVIIGGSHVSCDPLSMLRSPFVDFVIRGEGERPLVEFIRAFRNRKNWEDVPNLGFKKGGAMVLNPLAENYSLETLPPPDFSDLSPKDYLFEKKPLCFVVTSRGCPYQCSFCSVHATFGRNVRSRGIENILEEIKKRYDDGYRIFDFEDDNIAFDAGEMKRLCRMLISELKMQDVRFLAMNGICYWHLDSELLELMRKAGFSHLNISLVTRNEEVNKKIRRPFDRDRYLAVIDMAFRLGFHITSYQILGLPLETLDSMVQTLVFNARLPVLLGASPFYLAPGSPIAQDYGEFNEKRLFLARLTSLGMETEHFKRRDIYTLFIATRILNFLKGLVFPRKEISFQELMQMAKKQGKRTALGAELLETLFREEKLYAASQKDRQILPEFRFDLFHSIWNQIQTISTLEGKTIRIISP
jgi:radical SAM superfamily enzyme YgiQ (UPF0313 family)